MFGIDQTPNTRYGEGVDFDLDTQSIVVSALFSLGVGVRGDGSTSGGGDLRIETDLGSFPVLVKRWAAFPDSAPHRNPELLAPSPEGLVRLVVADRISPDARQLLSNLGWSWLDTRGHLKVKAPGLIIDADIPRAIAREPRTDAFAGPAGVDVACAILERQHERDELTVRGIARLVDRAPSTVAEIVNLLRSEALLSGTGYEADPELFWRVSASWRPVVTGLVRPPQVGDPVDFLALGFGGGQEESAGWALTGDRAAALYGADIPVRLDAPPRFYVPGEASRRRAETVLGSSPVAEAGAIAVVAPVKAACERRELDRDRDWPLAGWLYVALDLASDRGRGRDVLESWEPDFRVW